MARSVYHSHGTRSEQLFHEDLVVESIQHYGQTLYYIPRELVAKNEILGEDRLSKFKNAYAIEMYLENVDGYDGQGAFVQKFGLFMEQSATLVVARRKWDQLVGVHGNTIIPNRPCEGDLLYFPMTDALFEIKFVTHQDPFYQIGKLFVYKLQIELFQYASERLDTGLKNIDNFETLKSFDTTIIKNGIISEIVITNSGFGYNSAPTITIGANWTASSIIKAGAEVCIDDRRYICAKAGITGTTAPITTVGSVTNGTAILKYVGIRATATVALGANLTASNLEKFTITNPGSGYSTPPIIIITPTNGGISGSATAIIQNLDAQNSFGDNNKFKEESISVIFNENNPFGELSNNFIHLPASVVSADSSRTTADSSLITSDKG